jgi:hypothetical protein
MEEPICLSIPAYFFAHQKFNLVPFIKYSIIGIDTFPHYKTGSLAMAVSEPG